MNRQLLLILLLAGILFNANAQTSKHPFSIGIIGGLSEYNGDLGQGMYSFKNASPFGGLSVSGFITPHLDFAFNTSFGKYSFEEEKNVKFKSNMLQANLHARIKLLNSETHKFVPYLFVGAGFANYSGYSLKTTEGDQEIEAVNGNGTDMFIPFGAGFQVQLTERLALNIQETFAYTDHDDRDAEESNTNDAFVMHTIGLSYNMTLQKDEDKDGVVDGKDKCPQTPAGISVDISGCPLDKDGDGIADHVDVCPEIKGVASARGCPDADGDTITDSEDKCPDVYGIISMNGCPDKDADGITDKEDKCPDAFGTKDMQGCPDNDHDEISDKEDDCPAEEGTLAMHGCPDTDADGVADKDDKCPEVFGTEENKGCPEADPTENTAAAKVLRTILFETGSDRIRRSSYSTLNKIVKLMNANPSYNLSLEGHASSDGEADINMALSSRRAESIKKYLSDKKIDGSRLRTKALGESTPASTNDSAAGRAKNRRVEFKLVY